MLLRPVAVFYMAAGLTQCRGRGFLSRLYNGLLYCGKFGTKKGGINDLGKLRSEAKRNGAILTFSFFPLGEAPTAAGGTYRKRYAKLNLKIKKWPVMRFPLAYCGMILL